MTMGLAGKIQIRLNEGRKTTVRQEAPRVKGEEVPALLLRERAQLITSDTSLAVSSLCPFHPYYIGTCHGRHTKGREDRLHWESRFQHSSVSYRPA